ncbi:restriction endonuclease subunit S [Streptococcus suis]|uniref:restriction endonuclease subunit S n=1 Tax=Streptococcus suis TaxID=1307 RepID=UPI002FCA0FEA
MKTNNNIPAYRFQGYTDTWELRKLGEITEKQFGGGTPTTSNALFWEGNIPWIQSSDLEEGIFSVGPRKYITKDGLGNSSAQLIPKNSIAIVTRVGVGKLAFMPFTYTTSQDFLSISYLKTNELFTTYSLYIKLQNEIKVLQGTSIKGITKNELLIKEIPIPSLPEQEAIGTFFSALDQQITLHQRKLDTLKEQKKTYLKLLFPAKGQTKPALRFQGFEDDWEEVKVADIFQVTRGQVLSTNLVSDTKSDEYPYPVYSSQTKNNGLMGFYKDYLFDTAITWTTDGANAGTVRFREGKFYSTNVNGVLLSAEGYNNLAISEILNTVAWKYVSKVGNPKLMNNIMSEIILLIPGGFAEQEVLSSFFQTLDQEIAQVEDKLASLKEMKKTLLRKLFE